MHIYSVFLCTMFFGVVYSMELLNRDITIELCHFWSDDYNNDINAIKDVNLNNIRQSLKKENYLLPHAKTLDHLLYLSTIRKKNKVKTLFTHKQQSKFDTSVNIKRKIPWVFGINGGIICFTVLLPFTNLVGLLQNSNSTQSEGLSPISTIIIPTVISIGGGLLSGFTSLYATGILTERAARKANKVQDEIGYLSHTYATVAKYWIDIYFNYPEKARWIADKFDIEELKIRAQQKTYSTKSGSFLVNPLEEAWHFIKYNTILITFTEIENYLYNKIYCRRMQSLEVRLESLEKIVHEKNAEIEKIRQEKI